IRDRNVTGVQTCALPISVGALLTAEPAIGGARRAAPGSARRHRKETTECREATPSAELDRPPQIEGVHQVLLTALSPRRIVVARSEERSCRERGDRSGGA